MVDISSENGWYIALSDHGESDAGTKGFVRAAQEYRAYYRAA